MYKKQNQNKGFTLIEILIVISLVAILSTITIVAINPLKHFQDVRNAQRSSDISQILNAESEYISDKGQSYTDFGLQTCPATKDLGTPASATIIDISSFLVPKYMVSMPMDPTGGTAADTKYTSCVSATGRLTVSTTVVADGPVQSVTR